MRLSPIVLAAGLLGLAGCAPAPSEIDLASIEIPQSCGVRASLFPREAGIDRERPPACSLPSIEEVERSCEVHDYIDSPDYAPPEVDDEGNPVGPWRGPEYEIGELRCEFTSADRNAAACSFSLTRIDPAGTTVRATANFEHVYWRDDGPAHHFEGTLWSARTRCAPA